MEGFNKLEERKFNNWLYDVPIEKWLDGRGRGMHEDVHDALFEWEHHETIYDLQEAIMDLYDFTNDYNKNVQQYNRLLDGYNELKKELTELKNQSLCSKLFGYK